MTDPDYEIRLWMKAELEKLGHGAKGKLAAALGVRADAITRMTNTDPTKKEVREIKAQELVIMSQFFGSEPPVRINTNLPPMVRLRGKVGAGSLVEAIDAGSDDWVEAPPSSNGDTVAVEIAGDSMFPAYEEGTILYYSRNLPPEELVNRRCVVKLADERIFVKILRKGSQEGLWTLQSINPMYPDMHDVLVDWAAKIDWTKPR